VLEATTTVSIERPAGVVYVTVSPDTVTLGAGEVMAFDAAVFQCASSDVEWSIRKLWGSATNIGSITPGGQYQTPESYSSDFGVAVRAASLDCPGKIGIARVLVYAGPRSFSLQLESFTSSYNVAESLPITASSCGGAQGGKAVKGLDRAGEWVAVPVEVPSAGTYEVFVRYQANGGDIIEVTVSMEEAGTPTPESGVSLDDGKGLG